MHDTPKTTNQGEGNREADAQYRDGVRQYVESGRVEQDARRAKAAYDAPEGDALRAAEEAAKNGPTGDSAIDRMLGIVAMLRDETRVQMNLAHKDARDAWEKLETKWADVQTRLDRIGEASTKTAHDAKETVRDLLSQLDDGYRRVKNQIR